MPSLRRFRSASTVVCASLTVAAALGLVLPSASSARGHRAIAMADAFLVEETGGWFCPSLKVECGGSDSQSFASRLLQPGNLTPKGPTLYLRAAKARNDCQEGNDQCADLGVPNPTLPCLPSATNTPFCALKSLKDAKVKLGIVISAKRDDSELPRDAGALAWHACQIRKADVHHLYDFMFMDYTFKMKPPAVRQAARLIQRGKVRREGKTVKCDAGGWPHLIINDTTWKPYAPDRYNLDTGAWAHAKRVDAIGRAGIPTNGDSALTRTDLAFVDEVNDLGSRAVLRLEVTPDSSEFAQLRPMLQCSLLGRWARQQAKRAYTFIFPLFAHGASGPPDNHPYNSLVERTFLKQLALIDDPDDAGRCPSARAAAGGPGESGLPLLAPGVAQNVAPPPPPALPAPRAPDVLSREPSNVSCHSARFNGWVNPHGSPTSFHFEYWKRGEVNVRQSTGDGDAGAGTDRVDVARVADGLQRDMPYTGKLIASNAGGRVASDIFSFTTPRC
jgi:hypothetical protein